MMCVHVKNTHPKTPLHVPLEPPNFISKDTGNRFLNSKCSQTGKFSVLRVRCLSNVYPGPSVSGIPCIHGSSIPEPLTVMETMNSGDPYLNVDSWIGGAAIYYINVPCSYSFCNCRRPWNGTPMDLEVFL